MSQEQYQKGQSLCRPSPMADLALLAKPAPEAPGQPLRKSEQQSNTSTVRLGELGDSHVHREASSHAGAIELSGNETSLLPSHSPDPSAPMTKTGSTTRTTSSTASEKLAEISEQVNRILAPVHALEALKFLDSSPKNFTPNLPVEASLNPQSVDLQMPSADSTPVRTGGRRGRGPRRRGEQLTPDTITLSSSIPGTLITPPSYGGRGQGGTRVRGARGGRSRGTGRGGKRRRSDAEVGTSDSEASENFTPLTQSRSGRKIIHATPSTPIIQIEDSTTKASPLSGKGSGSSGVRGSGKKRTSLPKTPGGARAVCKNCGRAHSPVSNAIVFCDGCNAGWHQFCHNPPIGKEIILIAEKAWFCSDCIVMKEERVRLQGKVPGQNLSMLEVGGSFRAKAYSSLLWVELISFRNVVISSLFRPKSLSHFYYMHVHYIQICPSSTKQRILMRILEWLKNTTRMKTYYPTPKRAMESYFDPRKKGSTCFWTTTQACSAIQHRWLI